MLFARWFSHVANRKPRVRVARRQVTNQIPAHVQILEPRRMLSGASLQLSNVSWGGSAIDGEFVGTLAFDVNAFAAITEGVIIDFNGDDMTDASQTISNGSVSVELRLGNGQHTLRILGAGFDEDLNPVLTDWVSVNVDCVIPPPPVAVNDTFYANTGSTVLNILANDQNTTGVTVAVEMVSDISLADGSTLIPGVVVNSDGTLTYSVSPSITLADVLNKKIELTSLINSRRAGLDNAITDQHDDAVAAASRVYQTYESAFTYFGGVLSTGGTPAFGTYMAYTHTSPLSALGWATSIAGIAGQILADQGSQSSADLYNGIIDQLTTQRNQARVDLSTKVAELNALLNAIDPASAAQVGDTSITYSLTEGMIVDSSATVTVHNQFQDYTLIMQQLNDLEMQIIQDLPSPHWRLNIRDIEGHLWLQLIVAWDGSLHGSAYTYTQFGYWWSSSSADWPWFDDDDVADRLNAIGFQEEFSHNY